ncbi:hypothetical protein TraAM80_06516 [Trypanosoma rangeli]|uniref:Uncharacterized protein n=1 Tax=Trypanosoma rangeli TaxID=5698 RepID=A0A422N9V0_TRYRA|nr:uncharacterized protein TraAM80_06516 [Trypanosoma rangeli]RNF02223.1 hypothetical protein TraAM80_06516 [Trypanosoma rangeli]|eukprot:RNF02223.1 hypothetical protein TraAM80_06516 [Trypanosoma rangeli]
MTALFTTFSQANGVLQNRVDSHSLISGLAFLTHDSADAVLESESILDMQPTIFSYLPATLSRGHPMLEGRGMRQVLCHRAADRMLLFAPFKAKLLCLVDVTAAASTVIVFSRDWLPPHCKTVTMAFLWPHVDSAAKVAV